MTLETRNVLSKKIVNYYEELNNVSLNCLEIIVEHKRSEKAAHFQILQRIVV